MLSPSELPDNDQRILNVSGVRRRIINAGTLECYAGRSCTLWTWALKENVACCLLPHREGSKAFCVPLWEVGYYVLFNALGFCNLQQEKHRAMLNELVGKLTNVCWDKCISTPGSKFSSSETSCLTSCAHRYLETSALIVRRFNNMQPGLDLN